MRTLPRVQKADYLGGYVVRLTFSDGLIRELDLEPMIELGILEQIKDHGVFAQVAVDTVAGTIFWPTGVDLDPDVLHGDHAPATGQGPVLLVEDHLRTPA
jgi:hypothetical protein